MNIKTQLLLGSVITAVLITAVPALYAQTATGGFKSEPDKSMAAAQESLDKGDKDSAAAEPSQGVHVGKESGAQGRRGIFSRNEERWRGTG